ncbi:murein DD-endopeptidase MepM/ murein hydrolase activator NlpD [Nakamurella sp. UYEF19]|uniref:murein hydrolase activator EnvC family protein n=1 Tax=Nakamurella sp. UYEF19 TaxID=1756392 RepID=UPI003391713C
MWRTTVRLRRWCAGFLVTLQMVVLSGLGASSGTAAAGTVGGAAEVFVSAAVAPGRFVLPVAGPAVVLTPFRPPATRYGPGHRGVDLAAPVGASVRTAGAGTVVFAGMVAGRGVVSIDHPIGLRTTYEPVTALVEAGQQVVAGTPIGTLEAGHASCAPATCLHWGARLPDGSYLDPMGLLSGLRVRLLPWAGG